MKSSRNRSTRCIVGALSFCAGLTAQNPTNNIFSAEFVEYQFNETRGTRVANVASTDACASHGLVSVPDWHGPANRLFGANESGFGAIAASGDPAASPWIDMGWSGTYSGSMTFSFWIQPSAAAAAAGADPFGHIWGGAGGTLGARLLQAGPAGRGLRYAGTSVGDFTLPRDVFTGLAGVWRHMALVIDDASGTAEWYHDGLLAASTSFVPRTHTFTRTALYFGRDASATAQATQWCAFDDFRIYTRALSSGLVFGLATSENPTAGTFGTACAGPGGIVPTIGASGGPPRFFSTTFTLEFGNLEPNVPMAVHFGVFASGGATPLDVSSLLGVGCVLETLPIATMPLVQNGRASVRLPISGTTMSGLHVYVQGVLFGSTGAVTEMLDLNLRR